LPVVPVYNHCAVNNLRFWALHGMEEVIGSIPIRSTNQIKQLRVAARRLFCFGGNTTKVRYAESLDCALWTRYHFPLRRNAACPISLGLRVLLGGLRQDHLHDLGPG